MRDLFETSYWSLGAVIRREKVIELNCNLFKLSVIDHWKGFDQDLQLRRYAKENRKRGCMKANMAALDAGMLTAKDWNRFCMEQKQDDLFYFTPEHTQQSFVGHRKVRLSERIERQGPLP